jgi:hypothetical protein
MTHVTGETTIDDLNTLSLGDVQRFIKVYPTTKSRHAVEFLAQSSVWRGTQLALAVYTIFWASSTGRLSGEMEMCLRGLTAYQLLKVAYAASRERTQHDMLPVINAALVPAPVVETPAPVVKTGEMSDALRVGLADFREMISGKAFAQKAIKVCRRLDCGFDEPGGRRHAVGLHQFDHDGRPFFDGRPSPRHMTVFGQKRHFAIAADERRETGRSNLGLPDAGVSPRSQYCDAEFFGDLRVG